jgi:hypothetical protein
MLTTILFLVAIVAAPVVLVGIALVLLGTAVAGLVDGADHGLVRPNPG